MIPYRFFIYKHIFNRIGEILPSHFLAGLRHPDHFELIETYRSRYTKLAFMNRSTRCTEIYVDFKDEKIYIVNYTEDILYWTFGCNENPTWLDFLESRCFPKTRDKMKWILRELELPCYDPLLIIEKTKGRMAEDHQWIAIG